MADPAHLLAFNVYKPDSLNEDNYEIFTMELDGSNKTNITKHPDVAWAYLAHGDRIFLSVISTLQVGLLFFMK